MTEHHEEYVAHQEMVRLAQRIVELERQLKRLASAQGDLRHSAIDHGASIPIKDAEGNVTAVLGGHDEPLHYVGGPDPVQPEPPFVDTGGENVKIQHSGFDINNDLAPSDFRRARIYVSRETGFEPGPESFAAYMEEADGSVTHRLPGGEWYVGIVWETRSGKLSPMSETVLADVPPLVDTDDIQEVLDEATERIDEARQIAEGRFETLETGFGEHDTRITEATDRLTTAEGILAPLPGRIDVTDATASAAKAAAATAQDKADQAIQDALAAAGVADSKANFYPQISEPTGSRRKEGNLWLRLPDYKLHYFDAATDTWVESTDQVATQAATDAAQAIADAADLQSKYDLLALSVDGEGGLKDRLETAENVLEDKADASLLPALETRLSDAFGADISTALDTAAADATAKANAAQAAAEAEADRLAKAEAQAAQSAAEANAAQDALEKANAARDAAIGSASDDATAKANAAQAAAEAAAAADALAKADAAQAEAIRQAALDATAKADAAKTAAENAAKQYADQQDVILKGEAASDAQTKADAAIATAQEALDNLEIGSRNYIAISEKPNTPSATMSVSYDENGYVQLTYGEDAYGGGYAAFVNTASLNLVPSPMELDGETFTVSFQVKSSNGQGRPDLQIGTSQGGYIRAVGEMGDGFSTFHITRVWNGAGNWRPHFRFGNDEPGVTYTLRHVKLEKGNKATDWTPAPEDLQAAIDAAQAIAEEAHTNAGDAWIHADAAMTRAAEAESTAIAEAKRLAKDAKDRAEEAIAKGKVIDTRSDNQPPDWYWENYPSDSVTEFKRRHIMEIDSNTGYIYVTTVVPWSDPSGGPIIQTATIGDIVMSRESVGSNQATAVWSEWVDPVAEAKDLADNLPKVLHGTTAPSGTAPDGSIWWQHQGALSGPVIGQWNRVNGQWRSTPIDSEAIANLDVGKLTAGSAEIANAVIDLLWARVVRAGLLEADEALIGGTLLKDGAVTAEKITATREMITKLFAAEWAYVAERLVVDGEIIAANATVINAAMQNLSVAERLDFVQAFGDEIYSKQAITNVLTAGEAWIGGALIKDDTIDVENLNVTKEMTGAIASFLHLVVGDMNVNALWADTAWLTAVEAASVRLRSVIDDWQTILSGRGMEVISPEGQPTVQLGNYEETGITLYQDGEATASVTDDGHVSGKFVSANEEFYYQGDELSDILALEHMPRGVVAYGETSSQIGPYFKLTGLAYLQFLAVPGRVYKATISGLARTNGGGTSAGTYISAHVAHTAGVGNGWPNVTVNSAQEAGSQRLVYHPDSGSYRGFEYSFYWTYPNPELSAQKPTRILFAMRSLSSSAGAQLWAGARLSIEDVGLIPETGIVYSMGGSDGGTAPAPAPAPEPPVKVRRTKTYAMSWWRTWWANGNVPSSGVGVKEAAQGRSPYFTTAGTYRSMIGFPSMTSDLSGADIDKIEVRVRVTHSHSSSGGNVRLGTHNRTSRPSSYTGYSNAESTNTHFGRGQEKWITLPSSLYNGFKNGTYRGVTMFTSSTSSTYYVQANPSRFAIRVTYRK